MLWGCLISLPASAAPSAWVAGDLSLDGLSDLVLFDRENGWIFLNQGNGNLIASMPLFSRSSQPGLPAIGDLSEDGKPDLLIPYPLEGALEAVWGDAFDQNLSSLQTGLGMEATVLEVNHTSPAQVAIGFAGSPYISIVQHSGNTLVPVHHLSTSYFLHDLLFVDLTGDGIEELVALFQNGGDSLVQVYLNQGGGWLETPLVDLPGLFLQRMQIGSLNGDGVPDLLLWSSPASAVALLGAADGTIHAQAVELADSFQKEAGDLNQDGLLDVVSVAPERNAVAVLLNQGDLQFTAVAVPELNGTVKGIVLGSFTAPGVTEFYVWLDSTPVTGKSATPTDAAAGIGGQLALYRVQDNTVVPVTSVSLDEQDAYLGSYYNAVIYKTSDLAAGIFYPYGSYLVPDWTTGASPIVNGQTTVQRETLQNGLLTPDTPVTIGGLEFLGTPADFEVHTNQYSPAISEFAFGKPILPRALRIEAAPPAGVYTGTLTVTPASEAGAVIHYRRDGGAWQEYQAGSTSLVLYRDGTVDFYATLNGVVSPILSMNYVIDQPPAADSDRDDIPDALEEALGLPIYSVADDYDGDGWNDLDELVRASDPFNPASVPADTDADQWSDLDETVRGTDPNDPDSHPTPIGLTLGEFKLTLNSAIPITSGAEAPVPEGSTLTAWNLADHRVASATYQNTFWALPMPGNEPLFYHVRDPIAGTITLLGYNPSYTPCWDPAALYDGSQTPAEWIELVRQEMNAFVISRNESITPRSMAAALALHHWIIRQTGADTRVRFGDGEFGRRPAELESLRRAYDLDTAYWHLESNLPENGRWAAMVNEVAAWSVDHPPAQDVDVTLLRLLQGREVPAEHLPPAVTPALVSQAIAEVSAALDTIPSRIVTLSGTFQWVSGKPVLQADDGTPWELNLLSNDFGAGDRVTLRGVMESACSNQPTPIFRVLETLATQPQVVFNNDDTDGDGLPDQWEWFYFARTDARPDEDPDGDGYENSEEFFAYTNPVDGASVPTEEPTPTPTVTPTPIVENPTPTPTPTQGVPLLPKPTAVVTYDFSADDLAAAGFTVVPGGFQPNPPGNAGLGDFPLPVGTPSEDNRGLVLECDPGEVQLVLSSPPIPVGPYPVLVRCIAQASRGTGQFAFAALDGSFDGSIGTFIPADTQHIEQQPRQIAFLFDPTTTETLSLVMQLYTPPDSPDSVTLYIDQVEVIPLVPGTALEPMDVAIFNGVPHPGPVPMTGKPAAARVYECAEATVENAGFVPVPGGFLPGALPGTCVVADAPPGWAGSSADGRGLLFTCNPGETQLVLAEPAVAVGNVPVLIRMYIRASSGAGNFAVIALDSVLDGSIATLQPSNTMHLQGGLTRVSFFYQPTKSTAILPGMQLYVPPTASEAVSVFVDRIEVYPFVEGRFLEAGDLIREQE